MHEKASERSPANFIQKKTHIMLTQKKSARAGRIGQQRKGFRA